MSEWWTYRLSDFLMFEPETYYRLFELLNASLWPLGILAFVSGAWALTLSWRSGSRAGITAILAIAWIVVAWVFHYQRYSTIMLAAKWFAGLFVLEGILLAVWACTRWTASSGRINRAGVWLAAFGLLAYPTIGLLMGRNWKGAELFGLAPDPTAVVTLGLLLAIKAPKWFSMLPLLWCLISWATLWSMHSGEAWVVAGAGVATLTISLVDRLTARPLVPSH